MLLKTRPTADKRRRWPSLRRRYRRRRRRHRRCSPSPSPSPPPQPPPPPPPHRRCSSRSPLLRDDDARARDGGHNTHRDARAFAKATPLSGGGASQCALNNDGNDGDSDSDGDGNDDDNDDDGDSHLLIESALARCFARHTARLRRRRRRQTCRRCSVARARGFSSMGALFDATAKQMRPRPWRILVFMRAFCVVRQNFSR